jgi:hypothetical protein
MSQQFPANVDPELFAELQHYRKLAAAAPHDDIEMDLPEGARVKTEQGVWKVKWRKSQFFVGPLSKEEYDGQVVVLSEPATGPYAYFYSISVTHVTFGAVKGVKSLRVVREVGSKSVQYAFEVPGGFAHVGIVKRGLEWDESEWEQFFPTIRMIRNGGNRA